MNQVLPKGWSLEGLTIEGLSPEAFLIVAIVASLFAVALLTGLAILLWRPRQRPPVEDPMARSAARRARPLLDSRL